MGLLIDPPDDANNRPLGGVGLTRGLGGGEWLELQASRLGFQETLETADVGAVPAGIAELRHQKDVRHGRRAAVAERPRLVGDQ